MNRYMKLTRPFIILCLVVVFLSGCLYKKSASSTGNTLASAKEFIVVIQNAVEEYQSKVGYPPIKNSNLDTHIYEKYKIDLKKMLDRNFISILPPNSFESGGHFIYVLIDPDDKPTVKLLDLISLNDALDVQRKIRSYMATHDGRYPFGEPIIEGLYQIDFAKLGIDLVQVRSVYSQQYLPLLVDEAGEVYIDYGLEIAQLLSAMDLSDLDPSLDLRTLLTDESVFVPGKSLPYTLVDGEPHITLQ